MASAIAASTISRSMTFSRATASAICRSSSRFALTAIVVRLRQSKGSRPPRPAILKLFFVFAVLVGGLRLCQLVGAQCVADQVVRQDQFCFRERGERDRDTRCL